MAIDNKTLLDQMAGSTEDNKLVFGPEAIDFIDNLIASCIAEPTKLQRLYSECVACQLDIHSSIAKLNRYSLETRVLCLSFEFKTIVDTFILMKMDNIKIPPTEKL